MTQPPTPDGRRACSSEPGAAAAFGETAPAWTPSGPPGTGRRRRRGPRRGRSRSSRPTAGEDLAEDADERPRTDDSAADRESEPDFDDSDIDLPPRRSSSASTDATSRRRTSRSEPLLTDEERGAIARAARGDDGEEGDGAAAPARKKRSRRRRKSGTGESAPRAVERDEDDEPRDDSRDDEREDRDDDAPSGERAEAEGGSSSDATSKKRKRRRGSRGGRKQSKRTSDATDGEARDDADRDEPRAEPGARGRAAESSESPSRRKIGKRAKKGRSRSGGGRPVAVHSIPGEDDDLLDLPGARDEDRDEDDGREERSASATGKKKRKRRKRKGAESTRAASDEDEDEDFDDDVAPESDGPRTSLILVNCHDADEQRVAVARNEQIVDFDMTVETKTSHVGDIYRGRVVNLEPAIGAAFIDFGRGRNGFLHTSDVLSAYGDKDWKLSNLLTTSIDPEEWRGDDTDGSEKSEVKGDSEDGGKRGGKARSFRSRPRLPITDLLKKGQQVCVQVTKDAIGDKGPTLTTYLSIPGRYLVLMPQVARRGVSR